MAGVGAPAISFSPVHMRRNNELGFLVDYAWITNIEGVLGDSILVGAGETVEGPLVFVIYTDVEPLLVIMSPEYDARVFIYLGE